MGLKDRITHRVDRLRKRRPLVDHLVRMADHYSAVKGSLQAGAVTYFAFLSFFPILALAFAVIGYVAGVYGGAQSDLVRAISDVLPGMVSQQEAEGKIAISDLQAAAPGIFTIGLLVMLYSGLGWISAMRDALLVVFERPPDEQPSFAKGKLRDLIALILLGVVLLLSVAVSGVITSLAEDRKSTRLNSSHSQISYAVFCLKKKKKSPAGIILPLTALSPHLSELHPAPSHSLIHLPLSFIRFT